MKQLFILIILLSSLVLPAVVGAAESERESLESKRSEPSSKLMPATEFMSGASALSIEGLDVRVGLSKEGDLKSSVSDSRSPVMQGGAAAALVPFRSPTARFSRNILITRDLGATPVQTEPHLAVDPLDPKHIVLGVIDYNSPNVVSYVSIDGGSSWDGPYQPRYLAGDLGAGGDPVVAFDRNGKSYIASISMGGEEFSILGSPFADTVSSIIVSKSDDGGYGWSDAVSSSRSEIFCIPVNCYALQPGQEDGVIGRIAIGFLDKPWMDIGPSKNDPSKDIIYVTYTHFNVLYDIATIMNGQVLQFLNPRVDTAIFLVKSEDEGKTWSNPIAVSPTVSKDYSGAAGGNQFGIRDRVVQGSQPVVAKDGSVYVAWLDSTDDTPFKGLAEIQIAKSVDSGKTFSKPLVTTSFLEPDFTSRTSFFRSWGGTFPHIAAGPSGDISIVYVARPAGKPTDDGDVFMVRSDDGGKTWARPKRVNDDGTNTFQFFPAISVDPNGVIHIMWGDFRDDKSEKRFNIYYSRSEDGGATWLENSRVTDFPTNPNFAFPGGAFIGDYNAIAAVKDDVYMVWTDGRLGELGGFNQKIAFARTSSMRSASILITPPRGAGGTDIALQGFDFQADQEIFIEVSGAIVSSGRTDGDGKFTTRVFVPISGEGPHSIRVFDASGNVASTSFYMDFGFNTIDSSLKGTSKDLQSILNSPPSGGNTTALESAISGKIDSMQSILSERITTLESNMEGRVGSTSTETIVIGIVSVAAISLSLYAVMARGRKPQT